VAGNYDPAMLVYLHDKANSKKKQLCGEENRNSDSTATGCLIQLY